ncbi:aspartate-semialdehyde dehydrogenase [Pseudomonas sp. UL073]|uniref:Aspartate-semialdehyde dehydrogenase n=1 Tax=Zestomonas insulae TaxID=2809017 RepID=A0ABS2IFC7_9GAMM|nr:aspartate-semialdehyde dehydrogenase [Pseudomonas insulae]MBM7060528.1 aspartate-semialdehyde dehydrogenase [Pseudomonas insulae]
MLPPIPHSLAPITAQQDPVKPRPDVPPVTPAQAGAGGDGVGLKQRDPQEEVERQLERQRDQQRRRQRYTPEQLAAGEVAEEDRDLLEYLPRPGLWVDVEV